MLHTGFANATGGETLQAELEGTGGFKVIFGWKKFLTNIMTCFPCFRTLAEEKKKMYEEWMTEKRKRAAEEEVERRMERERLAGKAKEVEEEKKREKEVNAEKQARLARWEQSSPEYFFLLIIFMQFHWSGFGITKRQKLRTKDKTRWRSKEGTLPDRT